MCKVTARQSVTKYTDTSVSGLRWPTRAVSGISAKVGKTEANLTETQAMLGGRLDVNPSGDREQTGHSPPPSLSGRATDRVGSPCTRVTFCICLIPFSQFAQWLLEKPESRDSDVLTGALRALSTLPAPPHPNATRTRREKYLSPRVSTERRSLPWPWGLEQQGWGWGIRSMKA